ncbi:MAG TPA: 2-phospho-L-lactate guanylyltransferase [Terriglobales bacterium]|jgi:2-phospho-L-lactate guanylyltransferase|nr:2-phospho-L-lactate guanylyltransferase [Terriglobales bacterium]
MILLPVKNLVKAKQRLASALDQSTRTELAQLMLSDVVAAIAAFAGDEVALATSDPFATELAGRFGFEVIRDESNISETDAIEMATRTCEARGVQSTLVIPADIPLIEAAELRAIYQASPDAGSVLVPSTDKRGTNAVLRRPASLFPLRFGNDSFTPHLSAAIATNKSCVVLSLPGVGLDIDTPEDLHELARAAGDKPSQMLARRLGFGEMRKLTGNSTEQNTLAAKS